MTSNQQRQIDAAIRLTMRLVSRLEDLAAAHASEAVDLAEAHEKRVEVMRDRHREERDQVLSEYNCLKNKADEIRAQPDDVDLAAALAKGPGDC